MWYVEHCAIPPQRGRSDFLRRHQYYGMEISYVTEIIGIQKITEIPRMPPCIKGVFNLCGQVIPVMDVRLGGQMVQEALGESVS